MVVSVFLYGYLGLKVFMDAHLPVTQKEWGSLPPETAKQQGGLNMSAAEYWQYIKENYQ